MNEENKREQKKGKNIVSKIILLVAIAGILFSSINLYDIFGEYKEAEEEYVSVKKEYVQNVDFSKKENETKKKEERKIDFDALKKINPDIIGWIWLPDTEIDYPILQSSDNEDYLYTTFNGTSNSSGSIFVDCRNNGILNNDNTIIHGHNMKNGSMFNALNDYTDEEFFNEHKTFWIFTDDGNAKEFDIISLYVGNSKSNAYQSEMEEQEYEEWLKNVCSKTIFDTVSYDTNKKTVTLSTCRGRAGTTTRFMVHLQEKED